MPGAVPPRGWFVTLEGGEGAGKSTLAASLKTRLEATGAAVVLTREPGGAPGAERLRRLVLDPAWDWDPLTETLLLLAARLDHLRQTIEPALARGAVVLCDRYSDSTRAYQGAGKGVPAAVIETLHRLTGARQPDLTLILDLPAEAGLRRARERQAGTLQGQRNPDRSDRFESLDLAFHQRLRAAFQAIAAAEPERCRLLDATRAPAEVADEALAMLTARRGAEQAGRGPA